eukprot:TRINITY_DN42512_c0_g1_i1.p1 TRINITY_DN42512_c0_g1~~TRINITY_DN42512_c0_g1_i1.p1  ORF type:complete len:455 (-),score=126.27 TRINITY_DN42512_c0_g1_i1:114-1478(-)
MSVAAQRFLWACPHGSAEAGNSKRWKLPAEPCPESISVLNEWCQAMSRHLSVRWDWDFLDAVKVEAADAGKGGKGRTAIGQLAPVDRGLGSGNYKGQLNNLLHKLLRRPVVAGDVVYECDTTKSPFTATVILSAEDLGGLRTQRFTGISCSAKKAAEQSAAAKAIETMREIIPLPAVPLQPSRSMLNAEATSTSSSNYKGQLVEHLQQILGRTLRAGDVIFTTPAEMPPFVTSIELRALQGGYSLLGQACTTKKAAEQSAAQVMMEKLERDFAGQIKRKPMPGPKALLFSCTVSVVLGEKSVADASSEPGRAFCSKQTAKESAAWKCCELLCREAAAERIAQLAQAMGPVVMKPEGEKAKIASPIIDLQEISPVASKECQRMRQQRGWSQGQLADFAKQPLQVVQRLEAQGIMPPQAGIEALNRVLGIKLTRAPLPAPRPVGLVPAHQAGVVRC